MLIELLQFEVDADRNVSNDLRILFTDSVKVAIVKMSPLGKF